MAGVTLDELPPALALNGQELLWAYQQGGNQVVPWVGVRVTSGQIASFVSAFLGLQTVGYTTMRQLASALAAQGVLPSLLEQLPSDVTNAYNITWAHGYTIAIGDPFITGFLQPVLNYNNAAVQNLFEFAGTFAIGAPVTPPGGDYVSMRQLVSALSAQSMLVTVVQALSSDVTDTYDIAWTHSSVMNLTDPFTTGFLQPTLHYSTGQMQTLFALARTFPV